MDPYSSFIQGVQNALATGNASVFLITLVLFFLFFVILFYIYRAYQNYLNEKRLIETSDSVFKAPPSHRSGFNPAQKRIINNMIADFKRREIIASAIPSSVLERFSEFFYQRVDDLNISDRAAQRLAKKIYPIIENSKIEIELNENNRLYVLERSALEASEKAVVVNNITGVPTPLKKGVPLNICYTSNNMFICGESSVVNFLNRNRTVLSYPKNLIISQERLYSRIPVDNIPGTLVPYTNDLSPIEVVIKDISLEGARIMSSTGLKRKETYKLSFTDMSLENICIFENLECVISKIFMIENGVFEYGLAFIYLDLETRKKLYDYFQALALRSQRDVNFGA